MERIKPTDFGPYDGIDGTAIVQQALDASATLGKIAVIDQRYLCNNLVYVPSGCIAEGSSSESAIVNTSTNAAIFRGALAFGNWHAAWLPNADGFHADLNVVYQNTDDEAIAPGTTISTYTEESSMIGQRVKIYTQYLEWYDLSPIEAGQTVKLDDSVSPVLFTPGTTIFIREREHYYSGGGHMPHFLMANEVIHKGLAGSTMLSDQLLRLRYPVTRAVGSATSRPQIAVASDVTSIVSNADVPYLELKGLVQGQPLGDWFRQRDIDRVKGRNLYVCKRARFYGVSVESIGDGTPLNPGGPAFHGHAAMLDCDLDFPSVIGRSGVFFNAVSHSSIRMGRVDTWEKGVDLELGGAGAKIQIDTLKMWKYTHPFDLDNDPVTKTTESSDKTLVQVSENVCDAIIAIDQLISQDNDFSWGVYDASVRSARGIRLEIGNLSSPKNKGSLIGIVNDARTGTVDATETQSATEDIDVSVFRGRGGPETARYVAVLNSGGAARNINIRGDFYGAPYVEAAALQGTNVLLEGYCESGNINIQGSTGVTVLVRGAPVVTKRGEASSPADIRVNGQSAPYTVSANANGAGISYVPDAAQGRSGSASIHSIAYSNITQLTIAAPLNSRGDGAMFTLLVTNNNSLGPLTPAFATGYSGVTPVAISPTHRSSFVFIRTAPGRWVLTASDQNRPL